MTGVAISVDGVPETIENPEWILPGHRGSEMAVCSYGHKRFLVVIYRKISRQDGFVITAFFTDETDQKKAIWKRQQ
jgi:hypothetical protein